MNKADDSDDEMSQKARSEIDGDRRAALKAIAKYTGAVGAASLTVLTAEEAVAQQQPCSALPPQAQDNANCT